jgi:hypothetical protein
VALALHRLAQAVVGIPNDATATKAAATQKRRGLFRR